MGEVLQILMLQDGHWQYAHDKLREAVLTFLYAEEKMLLHRQVAEAIEAVYPENDTYSTSLLEHWHSAGDLDKEIIYLESSAEYLFQRGENFTWMKEVLRGYRHFQKSIRAGCDC